MVALAVSSAALAQAESALEEVVVSGIRGSVQQSLEDKRSAATVVDVITAEDIGKLPDNNVAESLSRVPGVQITRRDGDGSTFTVRGISQNRLDAGSRFNDDFGQLDASASYNINDHVRLTIEAQNLTKAINRQYDGVSTRLSNSSLEDQRLYFGVAVSL